MLIGLTVLVALVAVSGLLRLWIAPVNLGFLTPAIERALTRAAPGYASRIETLTLAWRPDADALDLTAYDVTLRTTPSGGVGVTLPEAALTVSASALLFGDVSPIALTLRHPRLMLRRGLDGRIPYALDPNGATEDTSDAARRTAPTGSPTVAALLSSSLENLGVADAEIEIEDARSGLTLRILDANARLTRTATGLDGTLSGHLVGDSGAATVALTLRRDIDVTATTVTFQAEALAPALLAVLWPESAARLTAVPPFGLQGVVVLGDDRALTTTVTAQAPQGGDLYLRGAFSPSDGAFALTAQFRAWAAAILTAATPAFGMTGTLDGEVTASGHWGGETPRPPTLEARAALNLGPGLLTLPGVLPTPRPHRGATLSLTTALDDSGAARVSGTLTATLPEGEGLLTAAIMADSATNGAIATQVQGRLTGFDIARLGDYWPPAAASAARGWVVENITAGIVDEADITLAAHWSLSDGVILDTLNGRIALRRGEVHYFRPLPPAVGVQATATYDRNGFVIDVRDGAAAGVRIPSGQVRITGLGGENAAALAIDLQVKTAARPLLTLLDRNPLRLLSDAGLDPERFGGDVTGTVRFAFPLHDGLQARDLRIEADATLRAVTARGLFQDQTVTSPQLAFHLKDGVLGFEGPVRVQNVALQASFQQWLGAEAPQRHLLTVRGAATTQALAALLAAEAAPWLSGGPAVIDITVRLDRDGWETIDATADLDAVAVRLPPLGVGKPAGEPGRATAQLRLRPDAPIQVTSVTLESSTLRLTGSATLPPRPLGPMTLTLDRLSAPGVDLALSVAQDGNGARRITVRGARLNLDGVWPPRGGATATDTSPLTADMDVALLTRGQTEVALRNAKLHVEHDGTAVRALTLTATAAAGGPVTASYKPRADGSAELIAAAADAGAAARALTGLDRIQGGTLTLQGGHTAPGAPLTGRLDVRDYRLMRAPVLAKALELASLTGALNALTSRGMPFDRFKTDFSFDGDRLTLSDLEAVSTALGFDFDGVYTVSSGIIRGKGLLTPVYALNAGVSQTMGKAIPLVGWLLSGGSDAGVFAIAYALNGPMAAPQVSASPLSILAPGQLRRLVAWFPHLRLPSSDAAPEEATPTAP